MGLDEDYGDEFHDDDEQLEEVGAAPLFDASDALAEDSMADIKALAMSSPAVGNVGDDDYDEEYAEEFEDEHPSPAKAAPPAVPAAAYGAPEDDGYDDRTAAIDEPLDDEPAVGEAVRRSGADAADLASFAGEPLELDGASAGFADPEPLDDDGDVSSPRPPAGSLAEASGANGSVLHEFVVERLQATNAQLRRQLEDFKQLLRSSLEANKGEEPASPRAPRRGSPRASRGKSRSPSRRPQECMVTPFAYPISQKQLELSQRKALAYFTQNQRLQQELLVARGENGAGRRVEKRAEALEREVAALKEENRSLCAVQRNQSRALQTSADKQGALPDLVTGLESALRAAQEGQRRADARAAGAQKRERDARGKAAALAAELDEVMGYANAMRSMLSEGSSVIEPGASLAAVEPGASVAATAGEPDAAAPSPAEPAPATELVEARAAPMPSLDAVSALSAPKAIRKAEAQKLALAERTHAAALTENAKLKDHCAAMQRALQKYQLRSSREVLNLKADREKKAKEVERLEATLVQRERDLRLQQATVMKLKGNLEKLIERYHKLKAAANSQVSSASQVLSTLIEPNKSPSASHANISPVSSASAFSKASPEKRDAEPVEPADGAFVTQPKGGAFDAMAAQFHPVKPEIPPPDRIRTKKSPRPHNAG